MTVEREVNRRTFGFTHVSESRLQHILDMCGTNSAGDAVDKALALLEWALQHAESGKVICALDADTGVGEEVDVHRWVPR
jgi:hypothetical protein